MEPPAQEIDTMVRFLQDRAREFGDRPALLFKAGFRYRRWSYTQVWEETGRVASLLRQRGLAKGDRVLLWGPNCPQWVLAFFGCMRAGVIVVPLDLRSAADFVQSVASKTRPQLAFVSRVTPEFRDDLGLPEVYLEDLEKLYQGLPIPDRVDVASEDL
ncbi:MAG: AMP-binding protein, partial [Dehalococcoidia bacterium]